MLLAAFAARSAAQGGLTTNGGISFINPGSPTISDAEVTSQPVPRLPDGKIDLTGPWVGGGAIQDIEANGGLKPGELPLLPWARELRDKRRSQDDPYTICLPMSVLRTNPYPWTFAASYTAKGLTHMYILHELGDAGAHLLEFICHEDNQYGSAGKFQPGTGLAR